MQSDLVVTFALQRRWLVRSTHRWRQHSLERPPPLSGRCDQLTWNKNALRPFSPRPLRLATGLNFLELNLEKIFAPLQLRGTASVADLAHGATTRTRTLPAARSARPPHPSRTPFPTLTPARLSLSCGQTLRVYDRASTAQRWAAGYSGALRTMRACAGRHEKVERRLSAYACHIFCAVLVPRGEHAERGWQM